MTETPDPFRHHPQLAPLITPPEDSRLRGFTPDAARTLIGEHGGDIGWILDEDEREDCRQQALANRWHGDLWIFAYGSLMWDPAIHFTEIRRAFASAMERRFILFDDQGGRGTKQTPGVMAALDYGVGCQGLVIRIPQSRLDAETRILWNRERIGPAYLPHFIPVETGMGKVEALAFLANHDAEMIRPDSSHEEQVQCCATGSGFLGTSLEYVASLATHFDALGIEDAGVTTLLTDARAYAAAHP